MLLWIRFSSKLCSITWTKDVICIPQWRRMFERLGNLRPKSGFEDIRQSSEESFSNWKILHFSAKEREKEKHWKPVRGHSNKLHMGRVGSTKVSYGILGHYFDIFVILKEFMYYKRTLKAIRSRTYFFLLPKSSTDKIYNYSWKAN